ncbi:MAG TPA: DUF2254 domain-containing protein [Acidimicrobiia bacterium]|nr:DUF2254 domain-containing protein [Acidimicrobiia bacterium]
MHRFSRLIVKARDSLYAIPTLMVVGCAGLALAAVYLDARFGDTLAEWPVILGATVAGGRAIASAVAGATITVAAIVFSITALTTQMASTQYSPRAVGEFFEDPFQQSIIGLVVGTFTYSLVLLASLGSALLDGSRATPSLAVSICIALGVASAIGIVAYINHSLRRMQIDSVVRRIASSSIEAIERHMNERGNDGTIVEGRPPESESRRLKSNRGGWVVTIDEQAILEALPPGSTAKVDVRIGEAVSVNDRIMTIWPDPGESWSGFDHLRRAIVTAHERSIELDPTFGLRQLVDIALKALSPGVNDPTTAVDVIHHLKTPVRTVLLSDAPQRVFAGPDDRRVFLAGLPGRSDYVHVAFSEIRLAAQHQPYVLAALIEVLGDLEEDLAEADLEERQGAVMEELRLTIETAQRGGLPEPDLRRILDRVSMTDLLDTEET